MEPKFDLRKAREDLLKRFPETPLLDIMPLIIEQDKEFIHLLKEEIRVWNFSKLTSKELSEHQNKVINELAGKSLTEGKKT